MIIFGWGRQTTKNYGPVFKNQCANCNNKKYWHLYRITTWFTLFFIPVLPYENKYLLICPVCTCCVDLNGDEFRRVKMIAENNTALIEGKISEEEHKNEMKHLNEENKKTKNVQDAEVVQKTDKDSKYCSQCGKENSIRANFCKNCGKKLN